MREVYIQLLIMIFFYAMFIMINNNNANKNKSTVGAVFGAQAQQASGSGPKVPRQWICREWVTELGLDGVNAS